MATLTDTTAPAHLTANKYNDINVQAEENWIVATRAQAEAIATDLGQFYTATWLVDGYRETQTFLVWPNGEVQDAQSFNNEEAAKWADKYWAAGDGTEDEYNPAAPAAHYEVCAYDCGVVCLW